MFYEWSGGWTIIGHYRNINFKIYMKQTAVEWLAEKYNYVTWLRNRDVISSEQADKMRLNYLLEAKEIEKEQSIDFSRLCLNKAKDLDVLTAFINAQQYYNETYKQL